MRNTTSVLDAQKSELPTYNLQKRKNYSHFHVDMNNVRSVLLKNKNNDKYALILYRDNTIKNKYRFNFLKRNKMATVRRLNTSGNKIVQSEDQTSIKLYTNKKYLNNVPSKRRIPHNIRNNTNSQYKLKNILQKQLRKERATHFSANAVFHIKKINQKVFLSREIKNRNDIRKFIENIRYFNNSSILQWQNKMVDKLKALNIDLAKILIIIQINNFTSNMYLNMGKNTAKFKHVHKISNKSFVNIKTLNIRLESVKKFDISGNRKKKYDLNNLSSTSENNLFVKNSMDELTDQLKGATFKEMCKMLLKLQCNSKSECKKLYTNYSAFKKIAFNEEIFEIVQKVVSKFSAITRAQQNANIEIINLKRSLENAVKSFEIIQSPERKLNILRQLEDAIKQDDLLDPRIILPSDYNKSFSIIVSKENVCIQTETEIIPQKETNDFAVQFNRVQYAEPIPEDITYTIFTQTSQNNLDIMNQISSNISTQTAISIHKCTSIQFPGENVQLCKNIMIHKINNSLNQVKDMYEANSKIMKQIANCETKKSFSDLGIQKSEKKIPKTKQIFADIKKKNEDIMNKVENMKLAVLDLKIKVHTDENVVEELKDEEHQMTVEDMKKKVDTVRMKVEDLKRQVDTQKIVYNIKKKDDEPLLHVEGMIMNQAKNKVELINQIKNTLKSVTERFKQNSLIIAEAANMKKDYKVANKYNKLMKKPLIGEESSASFKKVSNLEYYILLYLIYIFSRLCEN